MSNPSRFTKIGKMRPSSAVSMHGPGAVVDMPTVSAIMLGLDHWFPTADDIVEEPRLEQHLGVENFYSPPKPAANKFGGLPAAIFPEFLVCSHARCRQLAKFSEFSSIRNQGVEYVCDNTNSHSGFKGRPPAFTSRFMVACPRGHIDDFPWVTYVHKSKGNGCSGPLSLFDTGNSGTVSDLVVKCSGCGARRAMSDAFKKSEIGSCSGRMPWIAQNAHSTCDQEARTLLRGASNAYFSVVASAITIPPWSDPIQGHLAKYRAILMNVDSREKLVNLYEMKLLPDLANRYTVEEVWMALSSKPAVEGLRPAEWRALTKPDGYASSQDGAEFESNPEVVPGRYSDQVEQVVAVTRLREVRALRGFTRIDVIAEVGDDDVSAVDVRMARLSSDKGFPWLPAVDLRGEGIFVKLKEEGPKGVREWEKRPSVLEESARLESLWKEWRANKELPEKPFVGMRLLLVHSLAHAMIRHLALDSGYSSAAIRERIYVANGDQPMAGFLLYTASNDSDGSLGGLVDQARTKRFDEVLTGALREAQLCAQDPLCGSKETDTSANLNGSACHACLLIAENSCEFGNRLLDRNLLVSTVGTSGLEYFDTI